MDEAKIEQAERQRVRMIAVPSDAYGRLSVPDGIVELAKLRERVGEVGARKRRLNGRGPEALVLQVTAKGNVPRENRSGVTKCSPRIVR